MSRFDDYIRDIPMEIGEKFYPRPEITMPKIPLPCIPDLISYDFEVEHRARKAYDTRNEVKEESKPEVELGPTPVLNPSPSTSSLPNSLEVLQPCRIDNSIVGIPVHPPEPARPILSFEEFEGRGNVFDDVALKCIDDRQALSQILTGSSYSHSEPTTPNPLLPQQPAAPGLNLPSYPTLNYNGNAKPSDENGVKIVNGKTVSYSNPSTAKPDDNVAPRTNTSVASNKAPLRQRLLTKGYRENLVNAAMVRVPQERVVHIEYYMKGMSMLEKRGVPVESALTYLLDTGVKDKQEVLDRAQTADQLLSMGFPMEKVFRALLSSEGDRLKALESILSQ